MLVNPSKFSETLRDRLAAVKTAAQRLSTHNTRLMAQGQMEISQQNSTIMYLQQQTMHLGTYQNSEIMEEIRDLKRLHVFVLEKFTDFFDSSQDAGTSLLARPSMSQRIC
jgi:hypothetical protein